MRFRSQASGHRMSDTTTRGIRIQVTSTYLSDRSSPKDSQYLFAYHVKISNVGTETAQLVSRECIITSANDSTHSKRSLHYRGLALDFRTHNVPRDKVTGLVLAVKNALGSEFDVLLEDFKLPNEHLHIEHDPRLTKET